MNRNAHRSPLAAWGALTRPSVPQRKRHLVISVPHDAGADWFVYDTAQRTSQPVASLQAGLALAASLNG